MERELLFTVLCSWCTCATSFVGILALMCFGNKTHDFQWNWFYGLISLAISVFSGFSVFFLARAYHTSKTGKPDVLKRLVEFEVESAMKQNFGV